VTLAHNSRIVAEPAFLGLSGSPAAGAYLLRFSISLQVKEWPEKEGLVLELIRARVSVNGESGNTILLGFAEPEAPLVLRVGQYSYPSNVLLDCLAQPSALEVIEELRRGGDLIFTLQLQAMSRFERETACSQDSLPCRVNQKDWLGVLGEAGYGRSLLFEVPIPNADATVELGPGVDLLNLARSHLINGYYDEAVAACRRAIESLEAALNQKQMRRSSIQAYQSNKEKMTKLQRECLLREAVIHFTHPTHHAPKGGAEERISRQDAIMTVGITAALFSTALSHAGSDQATLISSPDAASQE